MTQRPSDPLVQNFEFLIWIRENEIQYTKFLKWEDRENTVRLWYNDFYNFFWWFLRNWPSVSLTVLITIGQVFGVIRKVPRISRYPRDRDVKFPNNFQAFNPGSRKPEKFWISRIGIGIRKFETTGEAGYNTLLLLAYKTSLSFGGVWGGGPKWLVIRPHVFSKFPIKPNSNWRPKFAKDLFQDLALYDTSL